MIKTFQTVVEMITQRGYTIFETNEDKIVGKNKKGELICIFTSIVGKFNVDRIKEYLSLLNKININHCIVVYNDCITTMAKKLITNSIDITIELFFEDELQYNITKHRLVPKHIRLSESKAKKFKELYGLKFPAILRTDPISRFYNYQRGDIIKIIRSQKREYEEDITYITYRIVKGS